MSQAAWLTLLQGAAVTLGCSLAAILLGVALGLAIAIARRAGIPVISRLLAVYVSLVRATPLITLCLVISLGLPVIGFDISAPLAAILSLSINTSSFHSEIWRGGLDAFPSDQDDAARAFGLSTSERLFLIVLPQVWPTVLPNLINEMTILIKNSPAIAMLGIVDITRAAVRIGADTFDPLPPLFVALALYVSLVAVLLIAQKVAARRLRSFAS